jgi:hypothetical protein
LPPRFLRLRDGKVLDLLKRSGGTTVKEIMKITVWQPHSVRSFLSGTLGKKMDSKHERGWRARLQPREVASPLYSRSPDGRAQFTPQQLP